MLPSIRRLLSFLRSRRLDDEMAEEIQHHIELRRQALIDEGMDPGEASYEARRAFGNPAAVKERARDARGLLVLASLLQDLRFGARMMVRSPGHSAAIVVTIALGAGLNAAVFLMFNAMLLRPPEVADADRLVRLDDGRPLLGPPYPDYVDYRDRASDALDIAAYTGLNVRAAVTAPGQREPHVERVIAGLVSGNFFDVTRVRPLLGRSFDGRDDLPPTGSPVVMLHEAYWERRFNRDPTVIGQSIEINFRPFTIVGIVPASFHGVEAPISRPQVRAMWVPLWCLPVLQLGNGMLVERTTWAGLQAVGRLKDGRTIHQARAELTAVASALDREYPGLRRQRSPALIPLNAFDSRTLMTETGAIAAVMGTATLLVLLIACANVTSLVLARACSRSREIAVRMALGAGRVRIVRQFLTESFILSSCGTVLGLLVARWTIGVVTSTGERPLTLAPMPDGRTVLYAVLLAALVAAITGVVPALHASKAGVVPALKDAAGSYRLTRLRAAFVAMEVALCLILLVTTALLVRSVQRAQSIDPILPVTTLLTLDLGDSGIRGYTGERQAALLGDIQQRIEALPGVTGAAVARPLPFSGNRSSTILRRADAPDGPPVRVFLSDVTPTFFEVTGLRIVRGRGLAPNARDELVISQALADRLWAGADPVGQRVTSGEFNRTNHVVVGVVANAPFVSLRLRTEPFLFRALDLASGGSVIARTSGPSAAMARAAEAVVRDVDERLEPNARALVEGIDDEIRAARNAVTVAGALGLLALGLALFGVAAVTAHSVVQRTQEIGIRIALGAKLSDATRLVIAQILRPVSVGVLCGLAGSGVVSRVLAVQLYGLSSIDPLAFGAAAALFAAAAVAAAWIPARRAARVDPLIALRAE
jgi:putative ABC transport system permease protein